MFEPYKNLPGKFSPNDGTIDFYLRIRSLINKKKIVFSGVGKTESELKFAIEKKNITD